MAKPGSPGDKPLKWRWLGFSLVSVSNGFVILAHRQVADEAEIGAGVESGSSQSIWVIADARDRHDCRGHTD